MNRSFIFGLISIQEISRVTIVQIGIFLSLINQQPLSGINSIKKIVLPWLLNELVNRE